MRQLAAEPLDLTGLQHTQQRHLSRWRQGAELDRRLLDPAVAAEHEAGLVLVVAPRVPQRLAGQRRIALVESTAATECLKHQAAPLAQYQAIASRTIEPQQMVGLTVGSIEEGADNNVIRRLPW